MKKILSIILSLVMIISVIGAMAAPSVLADDYTLVWSDEFDGAGVNPYNWTLDQGVRNGERQTTLLTTQGPKTVNSLSKANVPLLTRTAMLCLTVRFQTTPRT